MAMARPQPVGGSTGLKVAVIVFAALTVVSLGGTIYLYTLQEDLEDAAKRAREDAGKAKGAAAKQAGEYAEVAKDILGQKIDNAKGIRTALKEAQREILSEFPAAGEVAPRDGASYFVLVDLITELTTHVSQQAEEFAQAASELADKTTELAEVQKALDAKEEELKQSKVDELKGREALSRESTEFREKMNKEIETLRKMREDDLQVIGEERDQEQQLRATAEEELQQEKERNEKLLARLAQYKPAGGDDDSMPMLQSKDGTIVRSLAAGDIVYIDLGQRDGVRRGMTFSVYSSTGGIPADGKGKATVSVNDVFETTSECQVTTQKPGDPVIAGDVIANSVFDKHRQFNFGVAGDFDLDFDGQIEDPGGTKVTQLIQRYGGKVVDQVDTATDFVVLGAPPPLPANLDPNEATEADLQRAEDMKKKRAAFKDTMAKAQALSIPILKRTRFLHFLGWALPKNASDDQPAM